MKPFTRPICLAIAAAALFGGGLMTPAAARQAATTPTAADFSRQAALSGVNISPDGKRIAGIASADGVTPYIAIWKTEDPSATPYRLSCGERSTCMAASFIKSNQLAVTVRQTRTVGSFRTHQFQLFFFDLEKETWRNALGSSDLTGGPAASIVSALPKDPNNILIQDFNDGNYYRLNLSTGSRAKVFNGSDKFGGEQFDLDGEVRTRQSVDFEDGKVYIATWIRSPTSGQWEEHFRYFAADREPVDIIGFTEDPNIIYISTNRGRDKTAVYEYDIAARKTLEVLFEIKLFDASDVIQSPAAADYGRLLGFRYEGENSREYWIDERLGAIAKGLRKALGITTVPVQWTDIANGEKSRYNTADGADVDMTDWSDDLKYVIVVKSGASQPPEYYLLTDGGKLTLLGKSRPWMNTAALGDTRLVQYPARDGLIIPAFLTTPNKELHGPGPYPTIILPHGGPWARDDMGWDGSGWVQYFAARGYVVLQPQFRGSQGWGQKLWRAGDAEWGQKMQDDKDDGAKWLISQGIAAPDRIAMHGYSYGGYSAMAAAVRPNGIYQCAVAGAGVASIDKFREIVNQSRILRELQRPTINGLSPFEQASTVSIPIFLYHGDRDVTVPISESERFVAILKSTGKPYRYLPIKDMGHQSSRWEAGQVAEVLTAIDSYLTTECGPGGL